MKKYTSEQMRGLLLLLAVSSITRLLLAEEKKEPLPVNEPNFCFVDKAVEAGLAGFRHRLGAPQKDWIIDAMGSGVAVGDYDNDGDDDIYFVNGRPNYKLPDPEYTNALFRNNGGLFEDVTDAAGVGDMGFGMCAVFGDIDNDGWLDLFVGNYGTNALYRNNGDGTFSDITDRAGVGDDRYAASAAFADVDRDGDLDLFVGNYLQFDPEKDGDLRGNYHGQKVLMGPLAYKHQNDTLYMNDGTGKFRDESEKAGVNVSKGRAMGSAFLDLENDGDLDLYVTNDCTFNHVLLNRGDGTFTDNSFQSSAALDEDGRGRASMGVSVGDYNNDGLVDLHMTSYEMETDLLYFSNGDGTLSDATRPTGLLRPTRWLVTWSGGFCDFDADGLLDIYTVNGHVYPQVEASKKKRKYGQGVSLYHNEGERFVDVAKTAVPPEVMNISGRGSAVLDYDRDGDMDIVVNCIDSKPLLLENQSKQETWLQVKLDSSSARTIGVRVVARSGALEWTRIVDGGSGYLSQNSQILHFGFGPVDRLDSVTVHWHHRESQVITSPRLNQRISIVPGAADK